MRDAIAPPRLVLAPATPLFEARDRMERAGLSEAVVAEQDGTLVGLLTTRSLADAVEARGVCAKEATIATLSIESDETLDTALGLLAQHGVHCLPVVDSDTPSCLAGMLTSEGIARAYAVHAGGDMRRLGAMAHGTALREIHLSAGDRAVGSAIRDLGLPPDTLIIAVQRHGAMLIPRGNTVLAAGDALTVVAAPASTNALMSALHGLR